jgi:hypothetical protein
VAKDRVISTVDSEARHGHKTQARDFEGYRSHIATDPDAEIITATTLTPGNGSDGSVACGVSADLLGDTDDDPVDQEGGGSANDEVVDAVVLNDDASETETGATVEFQSHLEDEGIESKCRSQKPIARIGFFANDRFVVNLEDDTVTCPTEVIVTIRRHVKGGGLAKFASSSDSCALPSQCTKLAKGRNIGVGLNEAVFSRARTRQEKPEWVADYRATRPKVERKLGHLM